MCFCFLFIFFYIQRWLPVFMFLHLKLNDVKKKRRLLRIKYSRKCKKEWHSTFSFQVQQIADLNFREENVVSLLVLVSFPGDVDYSSFLHLPLEGDIFPLNILIQINSSQTRHKKTEMFIYLLLFWITVQVINSTNYTTRSERLLSGNTLVDIISLKTNT